MENPKKGPILGGRPTQKEKPPPTNFPPDKHQQSAERFQPITHTETCVPYNLGWAIFDARLGKEAVLLDNVTRTSDVG